jgi:peptidoglycan/xylan/chitin deacetylase (PgdA/CDA1 family)
MVLRANKTGDDLYSVTSGNFREQLSMLADLYTIVGPEDATRFFPNPTILITFDDGRINNSELAIPLLSILGLLFL